MGDFSLLAAKAPPADKIRYPVLASPKLDGIRTHMKDGRVVSRKLLEFRNVHVQARWGKLPYHGLDGELIDGSPTDPEAFSKAQSLSSSFDGSVDNAVIWVFDDFSIPQVRFHRRLEEAARRIKGHPHLKIVMHQTIKDEEELNIYEGRCVDAGYEGIMIRDPDGLYKHGRSTAKQGWLLKVKRFEDSECVIDDVEELMHNQNEKTLVSNGKAKRNHKKEGKVAGGVLGALVVRDIKTGVAFNIGTGLKAHDRALLWALHKAGKLVGRVGTYKFLPAGTMRKPRSPVWKGFREDI